MKFYDAITKDTIRDRINSICGTTDEVYSLKDKLANVNKALDEYWFLAAQSAPQGTLDDNTRTSVPVETQDLVSGTNAYKLTAFTNEVLQILRVSVLDSSGYEFDLAYKHFESVQDFLSQDFSTTITGVPMYWTKIGDYIYIGPTPNYSYTAGLRCYVNRALSKFSYVAFTITIASPGVVTATAHGLSNSDAVILSTNGTIPTGLTADTSVYYLVSKATDSFQLASVPGGTAINTSGSQTGTHGYFQINKTPGIPTIHHDFLAKHAALIFMDAKHPKVGKIVQELALDKRNIQEYWQSMIRNGKTVINTAQRSYK